MKMRQKSYLVIQMRLFLLCLLLLSSLTGFSQERKSGNDFPFEYRIDQQFMDSHFSQEFRDSLDRSGISFFDPETHSFMICSRAELTDYQLKEILWCMLRDREAYGLFGSDDCFDPKQVRVMVPI